MRKKYLLLSVLFCSVMQLNAQSFTARFFKEQLAKINDSLYAWKYETSNADFRTFLNHLQSTGRQDLHKNYEIDSVQWSKIKAEPLAIHYHRHPSFGQYPVVNISYEAAVAYCQWLTDQYHSDPKRKFAQVQFMLPTEAEWMKAAQGGRSQAMFPWGNFYLRNNKGQFLCNFKHVNDGSIYADSLGRPLVAQPPAGINDRAVYTAAVKSFWPNDFGIYNFCGNVSEMVAEKTFTKGGSWNSYGAYVQIRAQEIYKNPSPQVGFRVFMRVINP